MSLKGKITLIRRWIGILFKGSQVAIVQDIGKYYKKDDIAGYYNDLTGKVNKHTLLDSEGIVINMIEKNKMVYFPISIFQYALGLWDLYIYNNTEILKMQFLKQCEWIISNQRSDGAWNCFNPIGYKQYSVSSMGQGQAISVLIRAYKMTSEIRWLESAKKAINFMMMPVDSGGTLLIEGINYYFEEYPDRIGSKKTVLNGWIFTLFGIYDYLKVENDLYIEGIYNKSIETLERSLKDYDIGYWSYYDKNGRIASPAYHNLHIALLYVLFDLSNKDIFKETADKWQKYNEKTFNRMHAITKKIIQKLKENTDGIIIK